MLMRLGINAAKAIGFSLIEVAIVIAILGIIAAVAIPPFVGLDEGAEVSMAETTQNAIQAILTQAADRLEVGALNVPSASIVATFEQNDYGALAAVGAGAYRFTFNTGRSAQFATTRCGDVCLTGLTGFNQYQAIATGNPCAGDRVACLRVVPQ